MLYVIACRLYPLGKLFLLIQDSICFYRFLSEIESQNIGPPFWKATIEAQRSKSGRQGIVLIFNTEIWCHGLRPALCVENPNETLITLKRIITHWNINMESCVRNPVDLWLVYWNRTMSAKFKYFCPVGNSKIWNFWMCIFQCSRMNIPEFLNFTFVENFAIHWELAYYLLPGQGM